MATRDQSRICADCAKLNGKTCTGVLDLITGDPRAMMVTTARSVKHLCGPQGRYYEPKVKDTAEVVKLKATDKRMRKAGNGDAV